MIRLLRWLVLGDGHLHKWRYVEKVEYYKEGRSKKDIPDRTEWIMQCETCGNIKIVKVTS